MPVTGGLASSIGNAGVVRLLRSGGPGFGLDESVAREVQRRRGGGAPLPGAVRSRMEGAFAADFSRVRLHAGPNAQRLNERVQARAFTVGNDIFLGHGKRKGGQIDATRALVCGQSGRTLLA